MRRPHDESAKSEKRQEAIFGSFDGAVSVIGFIFGLLVHHSPEAAIAIGGLGGAIAAAVSMGVGEYEKHDGDWRQSLPVAVVMFMASLTGSLIAVWPFFLFGLPTALILSGLGCVSVATWIGYQKRRGLVGYVVAYMTLLGAAGLTLGIISLIPQAG